MTLGEIPNKSTRRFSWPSSASSTPNSTSADSATSSHEAGLDRFNQAGGAIMDDFDGDGLLDFVVTVPRPERADGLLPKQG